MTFRLSCSNCGDFSPEVEDEDDVVDAATDAGWQTEGHNEDEADLCPSCQS